MIGISTRQMDLTILMTIRGHSDQKNLTRHFLARWAKYDDHADDDSC